MDKNISNWSPMLLSENNVGRYLEHCVVIVNVVDEQGKGRNTYVGVLAFVFMDFYMLLLSKYRYFGQESSALVRKQAGACHEQHTLCASKCIVVLVMHEQGEYLGDQLFFYFIFVKIFITHFLVIVYIRIFLVKFRMQYYMESLK